MDFKSTIFIFGTALIFILPSPSGAVECTSSSQCPSSTPSCVQDRCIACHQDSECGQDLYDFCKSGTCYYYSSNTHMSGSVLYTFGSMEEAISYCNSHSNCKGIDNWS